MCEPGCSPGLFGRDCTTVSVPDINCPYLVNNVTLYQRALTCEPVCLPPNELVSSGSCGVVLLPTEAEGVPPIFLTAEGAKSSNNNTLAIALLSLGVALSLGLFSFAMWRVQPWRNPRLRRFFFRSNKIVDKPPPIVMRPPPKRRKLTTNARMGVFDDISRLHNSLSEQSTSRELLNI